MPNKFRKIFVNFFLFPITLLGLILYVYFVFNPDALPQPALAFAKRAQASEEIASPFCNNNIDKKFDPKFTKAINLIENRLDSAGHETDFIKDIIGCVDIRYSDLNKKNSGNKIEGKFETPHNDNDFSIENPEEHVVRISVDKSYERKDDLTLAFVLIHELTHAKQYFEFYKNSTLKDCMEREAEAFGAEINLFSSLNKKEQKTMLDKIQNADSSDATLNSLKRLLNVSVNSITSCNENKDFIKCFETSNQKSIKKILNLNENYIAQCSD